MTEFQPQDSGASEDTNVSSSTQSDNTVVQQAPSSPTGAFGPLPNNGVVTSSHKRSKKPFIIAFLFVLLIAAGSYWWFVLRESAQTQQTDTTSRTEKQNTPLALSHDKALYIHYYNKLLAFDTVGKDYEVLADDFPKNAYVIDAYVDKNTWRVVYVEMAESAENQTELFIRHKGQEPTSIAKTDGLFTVAADAEKQVVAYSDRRNVAPASASFASYVVTAYYYSEGSSRQVHQAKTGGSGTADGSYTVADLSVDGKKILLNKHGCFNCDGSTKASSLQIDTSAGDKLSIVSNKTTNGWIAYDRNNADSYYMEEFGDHSLGEYGPNEAYESVVSTIASPGAQPKKVITVSNLTLSYAQYTKDYVYAAVNGRGDYKSSGMGIFATAPVFKDWKKLVIPELKNSDVISNIGSVKNDCLSAAINDQSTGGYRPFIAVVCELSKQPKFIRLDLPKPSETWGSIPYTVL